MEEWLRPNQPQTPGLEEGRAPALHCHRWCHQSGGLEEPADPLRHGLVWDHRLMPGFCGHSFAMVYFITPLGSKRRQSVPAWCCHWGPILFTPESLRKGKARNCALMAQLVLMLRSVDCLVTNILCTELIVVKANEWPRNKQATRK